MRLSQIRLIQKLAVYIYITAFKANGFTGKTDNALDIFCAFIVRIFKDNDISALWLTKNVCKTKSDETVVFIYG